MSEPRAPSPDEARTLLREWASVTRDRDRRVRLAKAAGLQKKEIHQLSGISRPTIDTILAE
ncbi:hypothetical protein [Nocardiopsis sp. FR26]|uniref:hypothetical protein n=1 Tax=Nocardiopsis sp. FR26 TaxID=2605987 RepID=UPI0013586E66|nr:hypothetical protein [Nocardiopsis sp. FR26]